MNVSLIVLNYNDSASCIKLIDDVVNYEIIDNIVVVDNCSTDNSFERFIKKYENNLKIHCISTKMNGGYAYGNDFGCKYAISKLKSNILVIANPDIKFEEIVLNKMIETLIKIENSGIIGCSMRCHSGIALPSAWKLPNYWDLVIDNFKLVRKLIRNRMLYNDLSNNLSHVEVVAGSFFVIRSEVYTKIQGFDTNTFLYFEENILAYKLMMNNYENYLLTNEYYDHFHSVSINNTFSKKKKRFDIANNSKIYFAKKYLKISKIQAIILTITYFVGIYNFLLLDNIRTLIKKIKRKFL